MRLMNFNRSRQKKVTIETPQANSAQVNTGDATNQDFEDLGFGSNLNLETGRFILPNGQFNIERHGGGFNDINVYHWLITSSWWEFNIVVLAFYIGSNAIFALLFLMIGVDALAGIEASTWLENFANTFFFSIQTFTTVGYGTMSPDGWMANILAALNALFGLMSFALATGLFFARFSRPVANIRFSKNALIAPYQNIKGFMFRIVNIRDSQLADVESRMVMTWLEEMEDGMKFRRFRLLELERNKIAMFPLNWTIVHPIDEKSPLYQKTEEELLKMNLEFIIMLRGYDHTLAQYLNIHHSYIYEEIVVGAKFKRMYYVNEVGQTILEIDKIDDIEMVTLND